MTPDLRDKVIRQLREKLAELRCERSMPADTMSPLGFHQPKVSKPEVSRTPYYSKIVTYDKEQQAQSQVEQQNPRRKGIPSGTPPSGYNLSIHFSRMLIVAPLI
ncbi:hypothetical protein RJT34_20562 [Clitoria ternatea]|uniref:Uncharacterized protein n=1 Tax=Clitoria ternatea TaxID=43366 RepID=A0AAN9ITD2_CLITE